jgi:hypothetical protein
MNDAGKEALKLSASEKAQLIDKLMAVLDEPDNEIDELWSRPGLTLMSRAKLRR